MVAVGIRSQTFIWQAKCPTTRLDCANTDGFVSIKYLTQWNKFLWITFLIWQRIFNNSFSMFQFVLIKFLNMLNGLFLVNYCGLTYINQLQSINQINLYSAFSWIQRRSSVSSKNLLNKNVFKPFRKINNELHHIKLEGKVFQIYMDQHKKMNV